jgi:hypothetical protein
MPERYELKIEKDLNIYTQLARALAPHREKPIYSVEFIVEGTIENPLVSIEYPGKKIIRLTPKRPNKNSAEWANLYDFAVKPCMKGYDRKDFTYRKIQDDFIQHKINNERFWELLMHMYLTNEILEPAPKLGGIDSDLFLKMLKWMWIQEDLNYALKWDEIHSEIRYKLQTRTGSATKGDGRAKFFAILYMIKNNICIDKIRNGLLRVD